MADAQFADILPFASAVGGQVEGFLDTAKKLRLASTVSGARRGAGP